jgi:Domain of unknown function (DU1801)
MEPKTQATDADVAEFLAAIPDEQRRADSEAICRLIAEETGEPPRMWGKGIVGFGSYRMTYADGREADWMALGFAPRKQNLVLYLMDGFDGYQELLARLGKHSTGKACLYVKRLADVDPDVLRELVASSYAARAG